MSIVECRLLHKRLKSLQIHKLYIWILAKEKLCGSMYVIIGGRWYTCIQENVWMIIDVITWRYFLNWVDCSLDLLNNYTRYGNSMFPSKFQWLKVSVDLFFFFWYTSIPSTSDDYIHTSAKFFFCQNSNI
jgi:hypothetical protein